MKRFPVLIAFAAILFVSCASPGSGRGGPSSGGSSDDMVTIQGGWFQMGLNGMESNERPEHPVRLDTFRIDRYEVSARDFAVFLNQIGNPGNRYFTPDGYSTIAVTPGDPGTSPAYAPKKGYENYPANSVSWIGADAYCRWKGRRLPTEAEWEKAARGTDRRRYPWGDSMPDPAKARYAADKAAGGPSVLVPVDSLAEGVSYYGVYNMAGNVMEWVNDWYRQNYYDFCNESGQEYLSAAADIMCVDNKIIEVAGMQKKKDQPTNLNPQGPYIGSFKVIRGGAWSDTGTAALRSSRRVWLDPEDRYAYTGFRCAWGGVRAEPVATPYDIEQALAKCRPEPAQPVAAQPRGSEVSLQEEPPLPAEPEKKADIMAAAVPLAHIVTKPPCPPEFGNVYFAVGEFTVPDEAKAGLKAMAEWLKANAGPTMLIEGYSDNRGSRQYNIALSGRRANAIKDYLVKLGVAEARLEVKGYGASKPLCDEPIQRVRGKHHVVSKRRACPLPQRVASNVKSRGKKTVRKKDDCSKANRRVQIVLSEKECVR